MSLKKCIIGTRFCKKYAHFTHKYNFYMLLKKMLTITSFLTAYYFQRILSKMFRIHPLKKYVYFAETFSPFDICDCVIALRNVF